MAETKLTAELAGRILSISGNVGDTVTSGDEIVLIESMKMEIPLAAPVSGTIKAILAQIDDMVDEGQALLILES